MIKTVIYKMRKEPKAIESIARVPFVFNELLLL